MQCSLGQLRNLSHSWRKDRKTRGKLSCDVRVKVHRGGRSYYLRLLKLSLPEKKSWSAGC